MLKAIFSWVLLIVLSISLPAIAGTFSMENINKPLRPITIPAQTQTTELSPLQIPTFEVRDGDAPALTDIQLRSVPQGIGSEIDRLVIELVDRQEYYRRAVTCSQLYQYYTEIPSKLSPALSYQFGFFDAIGSGKSYEAEVYRCYKFPASSADATFAMMRALLTGCFVAVEGEEVGKFIVPPSCNSPFDNPAWSVASPINSKEALDAFNNAVANKMQRAEKVINYSGEPLTENKYKEMKIWNLDLNQFAAVCLMTEEGLKVSASWAKSPTQLSNDCRATADLYR